LGPKALLFLRGDYEKMDQKSISDLKASIDLVQYVQSRGIKLKKTVKEYLGLCPLHDDHTPSFSVNSEKQLWKCFGCNKGGDVITFVQELDKINFNEAVEKLGGTAGQPKAGGTSRLRLLNRVFDFYARTWESDARGYEYLKSRGITSPAIFRRMRFGFCNGSMIKTLSSQLKKELTDVGVLNKGREFFHDCVVFPLMDSNGQIVNLYGRHITRQEHRFLPGPHSGLFYPPKGAQSLILTEGIIDALTLMEHEYTNALAIWGVNGLTEDHLSFIRSERIMQLTLCLDGDETGRKGVEQLTAKLKPTGAIIFSVDMPKDIDINALFAQKDGPSKFSPLLEAAQRDVSREAILQHGLKTASTGLLQEQRPKQEQIEEGLLYDFGERRYRVLGLQLAGLDKLKVNLKVQNGCAFHIDSLDLYMHRFRELFIRTAAERLSADEGEISGEVNKLIELLEKKRTELLQGSGPSEKKTMSDQDKREALEFLRSPDLLDQIQRDFDRCGFIGEETSRLFGYLATVSRFMDKPLGLLIVSRSGAGKSQLQEVITNFVPPEYLRKYTRATGQSLFYQKEGNLRYAVLAIAEEKGAEDAIYSIRTLQSDQYLTIAVTITDPKTGHKRTEEYKVEGPVVIIITTTNPEALDFETRNRFVILTIDESKEQTERILMRQRERYTLEGRKKKRTTEAIYRKHHNAQRLLLERMESGLEIVNPYSLDLTYPSDKLLMRREHEKYMTLIVTIAALRQFQKDIKKAVGEEGEFEYVEVDLDDIALANKLAADVLGRSLDELSPHTRNLLVSIKAMVGDKKDFSFSRKQLCNYTGWSYWQVYDHLEQLVKMEYLTMHTEAKNRSLYRLMWDGQGGDGEKFIAGLIRVEDLRVKRSVLS
jgi:DNA primase catalytic core